MKNTSEIAKFIRRDDTQLGNKNWKMDILLK